MKKNVPKLKNLILLTILMGVYHNMLSQILANSTNEYLKSGLHQEDQQVLKLEDALLDIEKRYNVRFNYSKDLLENLFLKDRWKKETKNLEVELKNLLIPLGMGYSKLNKNTYVIFKSKDKSSKESLQFDLNKSDVDQQENTFDKLKSKANILFRSLQDITVRGRVTAREDGQPLPGVNVFIKGGTIGTTTNINGDYTLSVPDPNSTLVFSFIGYSTEEVEVNSQNLINIAMSSDVKQLSEVVVIGYGMQERKDLTGAIASVRGEDLNKVPVASVDQALQGRIAGVQVTSSSGRPGAPISVQIRGVTTFGSTDPLYVIDGVPVYQDSRTLINPNDIESLDVLKDASATAIYGSRAANGVVIITTKRGKSGATKVDFDSYAGVQSAAKTLNVLNTQEYVNFIKTAHTNSNTAIPDFVNDASLLNTNTDWQDELLGDAPIYNANLNVSGGTENSNFNVGMGYFKQDGIIVGTDFERYSLRLNSDFKRGKFKFGESLALSRVSDQQGWSPTILNEALNASPAMPVYDATKLGGFGGPTAQNAGTNNTSNPYALQVVRDVDRSSYRALLGLYGEYALTKRLSYRLNLGADYSIRHSKTFTPTYDLGTSAATNPTTAKLYESRGLNYTYVMENLLTYSQSFGKHDITALAGYTTQTYMTQDMSMEVQGFDDETLRYIDNSSTVNTRSGSGAEWALLSYLGRVNYNYGGKYLLTGSIRRDGSSRFSTSNRFGIFPSFSVGWRLSEEEFMQAVPVISDFKIRGSWGQTGNQEIFNYGHYNLMNPHIRYVFGNNKAVGIAPTTFGTPNIVWEAVVQSNAGIDLSLFGNKLQFIGDYFIRTTEDILLRQPIPTYTGIGTAYAPYVNAASVRNSGVELALTYRQSKSDLSYNLSGNVTFLKNEVISMGGGQGIFGQGSYTFTEENNPIGAFYGHKVEKIFQSQAEIDALNKDGKVYQNNVKPGDFKFVDVNNDGVITNDDRTMIGNPIPDILFGFNADFAYKGFDLSIFFNGVQGNKIFNQSRRLIENTQSGVIRNRSAAVLNAWDESHTNGSLPKVALTDANNNFRISDYWIEDGSFLRLRTLSVGYSFPKPILSALGNLSRVRFYATANNLLTFTKYKGYDPEVGQLTRVAGNDELTLNMGVDGGLYPQSRTMIIGIQVGF